MPIAPRQTRLKVAPIPPAEAGPTLPSPKMRPLALVVDADPNSRKLCREALENSGFSVREMDSGVAAVSAVREGVPDVIFLDPQLRDVPGRQAVIWLRSMPALHATRIIMLGAEVDKIRALTAGPSTASLRKPLSAGALRRAIQAVVKK